MVIKSILYFIIVSLTFPIIKPENNSTVNYIHVLFEWEEFSDTESYNLKVTSNNQTISDINTSNFFYIDEENINWNSSYSWQVCDASNDSICSDTYYFSTGQEIDLGELNLTLYDSESYFDGVTIFGNLTPAFSAAIDKNGDQIWNSGGLNTFCYFKHDELGRFFGGKYSTDPINILPGIEFNINGDIIFEEPELEINANWAFVQHEILKINDNEYLFFIPEDQLHPVPSCATTNNCQWPGGEYDWEDDFFDGQYVYWRGEKIILWNESTQSITWEWDAFDHIPLDDYDALVNWDAYPTYGYYDWTHFNAIDYHNASNTIYISSRHLSRIYKIDLNTGNILWSMGYDLTGNGDVDISLNDNNGNYNGFTFQHGLQVLDNGNIITLDNGNISSLIFPEYSGSNKTRAMEIAIDESNNTAEIVWEYILDDNLYGALSGNVQKLENGNYLITTIGDFGHTLEVDSNGDIISDLQYKIDNYVTGKMYRADRISSIHFLGCTDQNACNYDPSAQYDDNSCQFIDNCGVCGGNNTDQDCAGVCFGDATVDECGVCEGDGIAEGECDCDGNVLDCEGICGGDAVEDECDTCDNNPSNDCLQDCNGDWGGTAEVDDCNVCNGNNALKDCAGVCNGNAVEDCAGVCNGNAVEDCAGVCGGDAIFEYFCIDNDGDGQGLIGSETEVCNDGNISDNFVDTNNCNDNQDDCGSNTFDCFGVCDGTAVIDCAGVCGGLDEEDECNVCGGDNSSCADCLGVPNGNATQDCAGVCNGDAVEDCADICNGGAVEDCTGLCNGTAEIDICGICSGGDTGLDLNVVNNSGFITGPNADCAGDCGSGTPNGPTDCNDNTQPGCAQLDDCLDCYGGTTGKAAMWNDVDNDSVCNSGSAIIGTTGENGEKIYADNCPNDSNPDQLNSDIDGLGDACDDCPNNFSIQGFDRDEDGLLDACQDTNDDGDAYEDCWNFAYGTYEEGTPWPHGIRYFNEDDQIMNETQLLNCIEITNGDHALAVDELQVPSEITLSQGYPNPFNPVVNFDVEINQMQNIKISIYSINGRHIENLYDGPIQQGYHNFSWNASKYSSGIYLVNLIWDNNLINQKVLLLK